MALIDKLTAIANAVRAKTGGTSALTLDEMATAISGIGTDCVDSVILKSLLDRSIEEITSDAGEIGQRAFATCNLLEKVKLTGAKTINAYAFYSCETLHTVDLCAIEYIADAAFTPCPALVSLIIRTDGVVELANSNAFNNTPISSGTGYIYVPRALVGAYIIAPNWATYSAQFRALEDYTVDGTITGELDASSVNT